MFMTLAAFVVSASATPTPIDCSGGTVNISATGDYQLTSDASVSWDCIVVTGVNAAAPNYTDYVSIDCNGHTITVTNNAKHALWAYTDGAGVFMWNSQANTTACILSGAFPNNQINVQLVEFDHVGTGPNGWSSMLGIEYHYGLEDVHYSPYHASTWTQIYFGGIQTFNSDHGTFQHILCDNHWDTVNGYVACLVINDGNYISIDYVNAIAYPSPTIGGHPGMDDGVVVAGNSLAGFPCIDHIDIGHVTATNVYDAAVEPLGCVNDMRIHDSAGVSTSGIMYTTVGCYHECSFTNLEIDHNTLSTTSGNVGLIQIYGDATTWPGSTLTNVNIHDNTASHSGSGGTSGDRIGVPGTFDQFASISGVAINNNNFDGGNLLVQNTSTNYSGSSNGCTAVFPSGANVTC